MKKYDKEVFEKMIMLVRKEDPEAAQWLIDNQYRELKEFWDACEGMEKSFKWLFDNGWKQLAAAVDALDGNQKAKVFLLSSGNRELAAFVEATTGNQKAITWLLKNEHHGWVLLAKEFFDFDKKKDKGFFWNLLNIGNPFR